jgi:HEAT repeat protein
MMTTTLALSTLLGVVASYPLLRRFTHFTPLQVERMERLGELIGLPLMASTLLLPFVIYSPSYAISLIVLGCLAAYFPLIAVLPLLFAAPGTVILCYFVCALAFAVTAQEIKLSGLRSFAFRKAVICLATGIILTESALLSANEGFAPNNLLGLCAWAGKERSVPALVRALKDADSANSYDEVKAELMKMGKTATQAWQEPITQYNEDVRQTVAAILIINGETERLVNSGPAAIPVLVGLLSDKNHPIRDAAEKELTKIGEPAAPALLNALGQNILPAEKAKSLFRVLRTMNARTVVPGLLTAFRGLGNNVRYDLPHEIAQFDDSAIPVLIEALSSSDNWERWWARKALVKFGELAVPTLKEAFSNGKIEARKEAALILGEMEEKSAIPMLLGALDQKDIQDQVVWALGAIGDRRAALPLIALFKKSQDPAVIEALGNIKDPIVVPVLRQALKSKDKDVFKAAATTMAPIASIFEIASVPDLTALLENDDDRVVHAAAERLRELGDKSAISALEKADSSFHNRSHLPRGPARCAICRALHKLKSR